MRVLVNSASSVSLTFYGDESAVTADSAVTVTVTDAAGNTFQTATADHDSSDNSYSFTLNASPKLARFSVLWAGTFSGLAQSMTTYVDVVGGRIFGLAELRASDPDISNSTTYPTAKLSEIRDEVEAEFERITHVSFVPAYRRVTVDGTGTMHQNLPDRYIRKILSVSVDGTAYTTGQLTTITGTEFGQAFDSSGNVFQVGSRNVVIEYEYGLDAPPADVRRAALTRARVRLTSLRSGVPDRATSFSAAEGGTYALSTPGRAGAKTGIPDVDVVLADYSMRIPGIG